MHANSLHDLRHEAFNYGWDNSIEPALEIESGDAVLLHVRDASDRQLSERSSVEDVSKLDFAHVNPVSGPVFVKGAKPGDTLEVELVEFRPSGWGWTAIIPGFGLLADEFPDPWLRISTIDADRGRVRFSDRVTLPYRQIGRAHV
jgi:acetamidase/formamidase